MGCPPAVPNPCGNTDSRCISYIDRICLNHAESVRSGILRGKKNVFNRHSMDHPAVYGPDGKFSQVVAHVLRDIFLKSACKR